MSESKNFSQAIGSLIESKVFSSDVTLERLVEASAKLDESLGGQVLNGWAFITKHFIYKGQDKTIEKIER